MSGFIKKTALSVGLRGLTLVSKFLLVVYLAKHLSADDVGIYGLFVATISYILYLVGLDFYTFVTRELIDSSDQRWPLMIRDQFVLYLITYVLVVPLILLLFLFDILSWWYLGWFMLLLVLEHLSQESYRLLVAIKHPVAANFVMFFRLGAWVYVVIALMWFDQSFLSLTTVWMGWSVGVLLSALIAIYVLRHLNWNSVFTEKINWYWIKKGIGISFRFLLATLALRVTFILDRYLIKIFSDLHNVGIYTVFYSFANVVQVFIEAGLIMFYYPMIVESYRKGELGRYQTLVRELNVRIFGFIVLLFIFAFILLNPVLSYIGKDSYIENTGIFWVLFAAMSLLSLAMVPHFALYARQKDQKILKSHVISLAIFIPLTLFLVYQYQALGAAIGVLASSLVLYVSKLIFLQKCQS